jgi:hypothetical protein
LSLELLIENFYGVYILKISNESLSNNVYYGIPEEFSVNSKKKKINVATPAGVVCKCIVMMYVFTDYPSGVDVRSFIYYY